MLCYQTESLLEFEFLKGVAHHHGKIVADGNYLVFLIKIYKHCLPILSH